MFTQVAFFLCIYYNCFNVYKVHVVYNKVYKILQTESNSLALSYPAQKLKATAGGIAEG